MAVTFEKVWMAMKNVEVMMSLNMKMVFLRCMSLVHQVYSRSSLER